MKSLFIIFLFIVSVGCSTSPKRRVDKLSILQGVTSLKEVEFSIVASKKAAFRFELKNELGEVIAPAELKKIERDFSDMAVYKILFDRDQSKDYNLYVYENEKLVDQRLLGKGQLQQSTLRIAIISCLNDGQTSEFKIWDALAARKPEYLLMIGDNVYADRESNGSPIASTPETIWKRYVETRMTLPFYFQEKLIPVHGLWDDHDYGINDGTADFEYKNESKEIFDAFFAQSLAEEAWTKGLGVGGLLTMGDFNFYFLDGRSFRSGQAQGKHLGLEQQQWLVKSLKVEPQPSFIIKGDQFFGGYHPFESFERQHPQDFNQFVSELKALGTPFTFISGDRHLSEIMQFPRSLFGLPTFEITSSPMHSKLYPGSEIKNPWRVVYDDAHANFTIIDNVAKDNHWFLDVEAISSVGAVLYRRELAVFIKDLQNNLNEGRKRRYGKRRSRSRRR